MSAPAFRRQRVFNNQDYESKKSNKIINGIYIILLVTATALITYYASTYFQTKKENDKIISKLEDVDKRLTEEEKKEDVKTYVTPVTPTYPYVSSSYTNPYDCTYMGGCSRLYPTYPYYPYHNRNYPYHRDILRGGNIDLHKTRHR